MGARGKSVVVPQLVVVLGAAVGAATVAGSVAVMSGVVADAAAVEVFVAVPCWTAEGEIAGEIRHGGAVIVHAVIAVVVTARGVRMEGDGHGVRRSERGSGEGCRMVRNGDCAEKGRLTKERRRIIYNL